MGEPGLQSNNYKLYNNCYFDENRYVLPTTFGGKDCSQNE